MDVAPAALCVGRPAPVPSLLMRINFAEDRESAAGLARSEVAYRAAQRNGVTLPGGGSAAFLRHTPMRVFSQTPAVLGTAQ